MKQFFLDRRVTSLLASAAPFAFVCALALAVALGIGGSNASRADADSLSPGAWTVDNATGNVEVQLAAGASWTSLQSGAVLPGPAIVRTGPDSSATLIRDLDRIELSASTEVLLPGTVEGDSATRIVQSDGQAFFEVGPRPGWSFSVDTPYLAVVVKGTKFGVGVSDDGTSVSVSEGRVQVGRADGSSAEVSAGQTARSSAAPGSDISVTRSDQSSAAPEAAAASEGATSNAAGGSGGNGNGSSSGNSGNGNSANNGNSGNNGNNGNGNGNGNNGNGNGNSGNNGNGHGNNGNGNN